MRRTIGFASVIFVSGLLAVVALAAVLAALHASTGTTIGVTEDSAGPAQAVKVAFIGDQEVGSNAVAVLQLIKDEGADIVLHQGDFDYRDDPDAWDAQITSILGADFPYLGSLGNHDVCCISQYQQVVQDRLARVPGASCEGDLLIQSTCTYRGLYMVFVAPGVSGSGHDVYVQDRLAEANSIWRICSWHKNMRLMQVGGKDDETGWGVYEECRQGGGIVATGHEHSYSRSHLMSGFETQSIASTSSTMTLEKGKSLAFVSGLGGRGIRDQQLSGDWWSSIYTSTQGANFGALFCTFFDIQVNHASCYFKDIDGVVPDQFELISAVSDGDGGSNQRAAVPRASTSEWALVKGVRRDDQDSAGLEDRDRLSRPVPTRHAAARFVSEILEGPVGFEPTTPGLKVRSSNR